MLTEQEVTWMMEYVFGEDPKGKTLEELREMSDWIFVLGINSIAVYDDLNRRAPGEKLAAWKAYDRFGAEVLAEAVEYGSCPVDLGYSEEELRELYRKNDEELQRRRDRYV